MVYRGMIEDRIAKSCPIVDWLLGEARAAESPAMLLDGLTAKLREAGLPLMRATLHLPALHPQLGAIAYEWRAADGRATERRVSRELATSRSFHHSPIALMQRLRTTVRRRLAGDDALIDFPILETIRELGATDYALVPMPLGSGKIAGIGMAADGDAGFRDDQIGLVERLAPALGAVCEILIGRQTAIALLDTYVGHNAGRRILDGQIALGAAQSLHTVVFFCDMRGFTTLSETLPQAAVIALLNEFFACMVGPVRQADGEVLKFMGDGLLAIFPVNAGEDQQEACARAIIAAFEAVTELGRVNEARQKQGAAEIRAGIALHLGTVLYGNIGAGDRLDYTVIGPAVNRAARIENLTKEAGRQILTSQAFADACPVQLVHVGRFAVKGVDEPQEVYAPDFNAGMAPL